jgi:acyl-CoA thioester hydrolase
MQAVEESRGFATSSHVAWDELDPLGVLHHSRFALHVDRSFGGVLEAMGFGYSSDPEIHPDRHHVVAELSMTYREPVSRPGPVLVHFSLESLTAQSLSTAFVVRDPDSDIVFAEGIRTAVHVDRSTMRPTPWSDEFRDRVHELMT